MRAIEKDAFRQLGVLKRQYDEQAFFRGGGLNLIGSVVHIAGGRDQKEEARTVLLA
jgi:hypothetical protein